MHGGDLLGERRTQGKERLSHKVWHATRQKEARLQTVHSNMAHGYSILQCADRYSNLLVAILREWSRQTHRADCGQVVPAELLVAAPAAGVRQRMIGACSL